mgnify:CR=1 FL=1
MNIKIKKGIQINGEGNRLFVVVRVDQSDCEDTITELWLANDEEHLKEQVMIEYLGVETVEEAEDDIAKFGFDEDWGFSILPTEIGKVS